jgi:hypothetical protein
MTFVDVFSIFSFLLFSPSVPLNKNVDQQKQLRLIYDRFKEEVNLHLQDCRSTVEDLEADQIEIKGTLEKHSMKIYVPVLFYFVFKINLYLKSY